MKIFDSMPLPEAEFLNLSNQRLIIREINSLLLRVKDETRFFDEICSILLNYGSTKFVWVGITENSGKDNNSNIIRPIASSGNDDSYLQTIKSTTCDFANDSNNPICQALKTKRPVFINNIKNSPENVSWREEALNRGFASNISLPLIDEGKAIGVLNIYSPRLNVFTDDEVDFLTEISGDIAVGIRLLRLEKKLKDSVKHLEKILENTIEALTLTLSKRDPYTASHQHRVSRLAHALAKKLGLPEEIAEGIRVAGTLHDIGKVYVPAEILSKPTKLTESEFNIMKTHPQVSYDIIKSINFPWPVAPAVLQHHERMNGTGYPHGLSGEMIALSARILAIADVVEAMSSHRPYRPALGIDKALEEIQQNKNILYDGNAAEACINLFNNDGYSIDAEV